jgi:hypothetical protein
MNISTDQIPENQRCPYCRGTGCIISTGHYPRLCTWCEGPDGFPTGRIQNKDGDLDKQEPDADA